MPRVASSAPKKRAGPKNVKLAELFPEGTIIKDILKKEWRLGNVIGQGGFGLVYDANTADSPTTQNAQYVIKIEPGSNGPLFCEMNFYIRASKKEFIQNFVKAHKLKYLAVPPYVGSGLHSFKAISYRFLVMPRYGTDLQKLLQSSGGTFSSAAVFAIGLRMIDALQYLHEKEYVHADVKASNILIGFNGHSEDPNQVYLADYGLAYRYTANDKHATYKVDPRSAHNGTLEFTSRDAHRGVFPSRRGDLEILGYCLLQWLCKNLPWESNLTNPTLVAQKKEEYMEDVSSLIKTCFPGPATFSSDCMKQYLQEVSKLDYDQKPNYAKLTDLLKTGLTKSGQKDEWKISFAAGTKATKRKSEGTASPRISPKKQKIATKLDIKPSPALKKETVVKAKYRPSNKSPLVNGKSPGIVSPGAKKVKATPLTATKKKSTVKSTNGKSPSTVLPGAKKVKATPLTATKVKSPVKSTVRAKPRGRIVQIPIPSISSPKPTPATSRQKAASSTVRRVRKTQVKSNDASIQTTPGLKTNS